MTADTIGKIDKTTGIAKKRPKVLSYDPNRYRAFFGRSFGKMAASGMNKSGRVSPNSVVPRPARVDPDVSVADAEIGEW